MDVHKRDIVVAVLVGRRKQAVEFTVTNTVEGRRRLFRQLKKAAPGQIVACYEAGPCGYVLQREATAVDVACDVIAPSMIPRKPGDRVKTDRRDARQLAEMLRAGLLTTVAPPSPSEEALRDLVRAREAAQVDLTRVRHRLSKFLLRHGRAYTTGRKAWTGMHRLWLEGQTFAESAAQITFADLRLAVTQLEERLALLDTELETQAEAPAVREPVAWLRCFRGIETVTAITLVAELYQVARFSNPRSLMAYLGLVPSEYSSGGRQSRGGITKAGNAHVRRVLVGAAWHTRHRPLVSRTVRLRRAGQPAWVIAIADRAQRRLYQRFRHLTEAGKAPNKVAVAVARELVGFIWAVLREVPVTEAAA
jgi:transposase